MKKGIERIKIMKCEVKKKKKDRHPGAGRSLSGEMEEMKGIILGLD